MKPIGKYILIQKITEETKTESGLLLSAEDAKQMRYQKATVKAVGTEVSTISDTDTIYYDSRAGHQMIINGETYTVISLSDVVVVL